MNTTEKLRKKHSSFLNDFESAKKSFYRDCFVNLDYSTTDPEVLKKEIEKINNSVNAKQSIKSITEKFVELLQLCISESKMYEDGKIYSSDFSTKTPNVMYRGDESDFGITFGLFNKFYIVTELEHLSSLKDMPDKFWAQLFELNSLGKFVFMEKDELSKSIKKNNPHLSNKRNSLYKFMRNYFLNKGEFKNSDSLGFLKIEWKRSSKIEDIIAEICSAFQIMYNLNYMLWKEDNLSR